MVRPVVGAGTAVTLLCAPIAVTTVARLAEEFSNDPETAAKGTRDLVADARFFGLAAVVKGRPVTVTQQLKTGMYYLFYVNLVRAGQPPNLTTLQVSRSGDDLADREVDGPGHATVRLTSADLFVSPDVLLKAGTLTVRNVADTIHFMEVQPVNPGTTDAQIQAFLDSGTQGKPPFALNGPSIKLGVLSPDRHADITYTLPAGRHLCPAVLYCRRQDRDSACSHWHAQGGHT